MRRVAFLVLFLAALVFVRCKKSSSPTNHTPTAVPADTVIHITSLSALSVEADSLSTCQITVQLDPTTTPRDNFVIFSTTLGQFPNGLNTDTSAVNVYGVAVLPLLSNIAGSAFVSARVDGILVDTTVSFTPALPDGMFCVANPYVGADSVDFHIACDLYRDQGRGKVSDPIQVLFSFLPATGNYNAPALILPPVANSIAGVVTDSVQNPYHNTGNFVIVATTTLANGNPLSTPIILVIN